jgi:hypothetical protein
MLCQIQTKRVLLPNFVIGQFRAQIDTTLSSFTHQFLYPKQESDCYCPTAALSPTRGLFSHGPSRVFLLIAHRSPRFFKEVDNPFPRIFLRRPATTSILHLLHEISSPQVQVVRIADHFSNQLEANGDLAADATM